MEKSIKLDDATVVKLEQMNGSIERWSIQYARLMLKARGAEDQIAGLYQAREDLLVSEIFDKTGLDRTKVDGININEEGMIIFNKKD
jgi:hypothetical protein